MTESVVVSAAVFVVSVGLLWVGAELFVTNAARVARRFGLSDLVVGLTVVAMGTSAPEAAVSIDAALVGNGDIAVANVVGSNLFNLGIVLGGIAAAVRVRSSPQMLRRDGTVMVGSTVLLLVFLWDLHVTRFEGAVLLVVFVSYLAVLLLRPGEAPTETGTEMVSKTGTEMPTTGTTWRTPVALVVGLALVVGGAHVLVESASTIARSAGLSEWVIGETIVAVGTSTPEIVASVAAARKGMGDVAAGNLVGSNVFNALFILGATTTLAPIRVSATAIGTMTWLLGLSIFAVVLLGTRGRLGRLEGAVLVAVNLSRWALDLL